MDNIYINFLVTVFLGYLGVHKFAKKQIGLGLLYFFTGGLFGIGWIYDCIMAFLPIGKQVFPALSMESERIQQNFISDRRPTGTYQTNRQPRQQYDSMGNQEFKYYCADVLRKNGFENIKVLHGMVTYGIDLLAEKDSLVYAIRCRCNSDPIHSDLVQEIVSGKEYYGTTRGVIFTSQYLDSAVEETANYYKIIVWNRDRLNGMIRYFTKDKTSTYEDKDRKREIKETMQPIAEKIKELFGTKFHVQVMPKDYTYDNQAMNFVFQAYQNQLDYIVSLQDEFCHLLDKQVIIHTLSENSFVLSINKQ